MHGALYIIKQMVLSTKFMEQVNVIEASKPNWEIASRSKKENKIKRITTAARLSQQPRLCLIEPKRLGAR
jgi:hypothetical protein